MGVGCVGRPAPQRPDGRAGVRARPRHGLLGLHRTPPGGGGDLQRSRSSRPPPCAGPASAASPYFSSPWSSLSSLLAPALPMHRSDGRVSTARTASRISRAFAPRGDDPPDTVVGTPTGFRGRSPCTAMTTGGTPAASPPLIVPKPPRVMTTSQRGSRWTCASHFDRTCAGWGHIRWSDAPDTGHQVAALFTPPGQLRHLEPGVSRPPRSSPAPPGPRAIRQGVQPILSWRSPRAILGR